MEFKGRYVVPGTPEAVWSALNDPEILTRCIPGAEGVRQTGPGAFVARATLKVGPVKATFDGKVTVTEETPPDGFAHAGKLIGEGLGGAAGFARGEARILLAPEGASTVLTYDAQATIGGRLAQIGQRLIDGAAKAIADEFFGKFATVMSPPVTEAPHETAPLVPESQSPHGERASRRGEGEGLSPQIWIVGLIGIVIILLVLFGLAL